MQVTAYPIVPAGIDRRACRAILFSSGWIVCSPLLARLPAQSLRHGMPVTRLHQDDLQHVATIAGDIAMAGLITFSVVNTTWSGPRYTRTVMSTVRIAQRCRATLRCRSVTPSHGFHDHAVETATIHAARQPARASSRHGLRRNSRIHALPSPAMTTPSGWEPRPGSDARARQVGECHAGLEAGLPDEADPRRQVPRRYRTRRRTRAGRRPRWRAGTRRGEVTAQSRQPRFIPNRVPRAGQRAGRGQRGPRDGQGVACPLKRDGPRPARPL